MRPLLLLTALLMIATSATAGEKPPPKKFGGDLFIDGLLKQMDADGDGKISKSEAKGKLAEGFPLLDTNKDGFIDRPEIRAIAQRITDQKKAPAPVNPANDFDSFDKNADGRLTPDELRGSRWATTFAQIDADTSGQIDRREFDAFMKKQEKK